MESLNQLTSLIPRHLNEIESPTEEPPHIPSPLNQTEPTEHHVSGEHHSGVHIPAETLVMMFVILCLIISAFAKHLSKKYSLPYTPILYVISAFLGAQSENLGRYIQLMVETILETNPVKYIFKNFIKKFYLKFNLKMMTCIKI